jgi:hypothetical protein
LFWLFLIGSFESVRGRKLEICLLWFILVSNMKAPKFLKSSRNRLLFVCTILISCVVATIYCTYSESYVETFLAQFIPEYSKIITVAVPVIIGSIVLGLCIEIIGGDLHDWLKGKETNSQMLIENIEPVIQLFFNSIEQRYENNLGKQINVSFASSVAQENASYTRTKESDEIKIFPSKKIYGRLNIDDDDWRKEFTVCYPIIKGIETESALHKINSALNYERNFDISIQEAIESDFWLTELDYSIRLIKRPFLVIELHMDGIGAYPWHVSRNLVINFETGNVIKINDLLDEEHLPRLALVITEFIQHDFEIANLQDFYHEEIPIEPKRKNPHLKKYYGDQKFTLDNFQDFYFDEYSITFIYDFGFPHVIKAIEPEGHYCFSFHSVKNFIKKDSVLESLIAENNLY